MHKTKKVFLVLFMIFMWLPSARVSAGQQEVTNLNNYCHDNFARNLQDGTDAEIVCRVGDPNDVIDEDQSYWDALTEEEKVAQRSKNHCEELYGSDQDIVESCEDLNDPHTGIAYSAEIDADCEEGIDPDNCKISAYLLLFTNALSATVGIVIVIMLVAGGIQYSSARDNPQAVQAAKGHITNALLALFVYIFMFAFLQYIVPGGVLN